MESSREEIPHGRHRGLRNAADLSMAYADFDQRLRALAQQTAELDESHSPDSELFISDTIWRTPSQ